MRAHQPIAPLPVQRPPHPSPRRRHITLQRVPHHRTITPHIGHGRQTAIPGKRARVMRLATTGGVEGRGIQSHPAPVLDHHNGGVKHPALGFAQIDAIGDGLSTHKTPSLARQARRSEPTPAPHPRVGHTRTKHGVTDSIGVVTVPLESPSSDSGVLRAVDSTKTGVGTFVSGVLALAASTIIDPFAGIGITALVSSVQKFKLLSRPDARAETVYQLAAAEMHQRIGAGENVRSDGFFDETHDQRSAGEEAWERMLWRCRQESSERKLPYMAHLLAGVSFDTSVDLDTAHQLIAAAEELSYRQLSLMRLAVVVEEYPIRPDDYRDQVHYSSDLYPVLYECVHLCQLGFASFGGDVVFGPSNIKPAEMKLQGLGSDVYRLMRLSDIPKADVAKVAEPLRE